LAAIASTASPSTVRFAQAEEVHLQQAQVLADRVVELGDHRPVGLAPPQRDVVDQRLPAHDHAGRVHPGLPDQALEARARLPMTWRTSDSASYRARTLPALAVPGPAGLEHRGQRHVPAQHRRRHRLGDPVADGVGEPSTRAESLTAALALIVPKVTICATRSSPYLPVT